MNKHQRHALATLAALPDAERPYLIHEAADALAKVLGPHTLAVVAHSLDQARRNCDLTEREADCCSLLHGLLLDIMTERTVGHAILG